VAAWVEQSHANLGDVGVWCANEAVDRGEGYEVNGGRPGRRRPHPPSGARPRQVPERENDMTDTASFHLDRMNEAFAVDGFAVTRDRVAAFAAATNEHRHVYTSGEIAPPVFAVVPGFEATVAACAAVVPDELAKSVVHGEQIFEFHRPIASGAVLDSVSRCTGVLAKSTGTLVVIETTSHERGELVVTQHMICFVRGVRAEESRGALPPAHEVYGRSESAKQVPDKFDLDQTQRYAEASGDHMPIHLDEKFARSVGLPGVIIHGFCTLAFVARAAVETTCSDDPGRLRTLRARFATPGRPGEQIVTTVKRAAVIGDSEFFELDAVERTSGRPLVVRGMAQVAS